MIVLCLEGAHGSGKTSLIEQFKEKGFNVLDEAFVGMPSYGLHPQSLLMETIWLARWSERLLAFDKTNSTSEIFIADRSPYSAELYARSGGELLGPLIDKHLEELASQADIHVFTVHVKVDPKLLWGRICARLEREPHRSKFNEGSVEWMNRVLDFYNSKPWDFTVQNNDNTVEEAMFDIIMRVSQHNQRFHLASPIKFSFMQSPEAGYCILDQSTPMECGVVSAEASPRFPRQTKTGEFEGEIDSENIAPVAGMSRRRVFAVVNGSARAFEDETQALRAISGNS